MCWIFWYKWNKDATWILIKWLQRLEYRGYDSAGIFVSDWKKNFLAKEVWKVSALMTKLWKHDIWFTQGIAHTRRATHGGVTKENTHPHVSNDGKWHIVHNWIIENYKKIKKDLLTKWYTFDSETDTEIVANLLQELYAWDMLTTCKLLQEHIRGAYALLIVNTDYPDEMISLRLGSPLVYATNKEKEHFFSSDTQALAWYVKNLIYLEDGDLLHVQQDDYTIYSNGEVCKRDIEKFDQEALEASKGDFKHFMLKEIYEQPNVVKRIYKWRITFDDKALHADAFHGMWSENYKNISIVWCGTSYHAWWLWSYWLQNLSSIPTHAEIASEYENKPFFVDPSKLHIFISQSWETADSLEVLKLIKDQWGKTFGIVNVTWSSIARTTDSGLYQRAGTEIGVASTKAFTAQGLCMLLVSLFLGKRRWMRLAKYKQILKELEQLPSYIETVLDQSDHIRSIAMDLIHYQDFFFLWRGYQYPIAAESSLKFKEITYLHSESYAAWELKHGSLALISDKVPTIFNIPHDEMFEANLSNLQEIKAREWKVCVISDKRIEEATRQIDIPETCDEVYPFLTAVAGQLLAYHVADLLGNDIDKPRNLAKSVTVK